MIIYLPDSKSQRSQKSQNYFCVCLYGRMRSQAPVHYKDLSYPLPNLEDMSHSNELRVQTILLKTTMYIITTAHGSPLLVFS